MPAVPEDAQAVGEGAFGGPGPSIALGETQTVETLFTENKVVDEKGRPVLQPTAKWGRGIRNRKKTMLNKKEPLVEQSEPEEDSPGQPEPEWPGYIVIGDLVGDMQLQEAGALDQDLAGQADDIEPEDLEELVPMPSLATAW